VPVDKSSYDKVESKYDSKPQDGSDGSKVPDTALTSPPVPSKEEKPSGLPITTDIGGARDENRAPGSPTQPRGSTGTHEKGTSSTTTATGGSRLSSGKPSLLNRIKGEVKVISGKLSKNEEKIEEGMKLKGKLPNGESST
jgi:hypothetical protein